MNGLTEEIDRHAADRSDTSFARLLRWLDDGTDSGGETYLSTRRRLAAYFDRRGCPAADALADETLDRVSTTLDTEVDRARRHGAVPCQEHGTQPRRGRSAFAGAA